MKYLIIITVLLLSSVAAISQNKTKSFSYLKTLQVGEYKYPVHYDESTSKIINKELGDLSIDDPLYQGDYFKEDVLVMECQIDKNSDEKYYLVFSYGPSGDPSFNFYSYQTKELLYSVAGKEIYIPANNNVYVTGHTNNTFDQRKKFALMDNKLIELNQPFYYVGLKTKTLKTLQVYSDKGLTKKLAMLPKDYDIEVLLTDITGENSSDLKYLIKTPFGLVGWTLIRAGQYEPIDVDGIFYNGD